MLALLSVVWGASYLLIAEAIEEVAERIGARLDGRATILGEDVRQYRSDR